VTNALAALQKSPFPVELNGVTREYLARMAATEAGGTAADLRAVLATPPDAAAAARLSESPRYNATLRTTCVPTLMSAGHAPNALPQRAEANVNCRILPGHSQEEIRLELVRIFNDPALTVRYRNDAGQLVEHGSDRKAMPPPPLRTDVMDALRSVAGRFWPGAAVVPIMMMWASDSVHTMMAGIPSYGISGVAVDRNDVRMHGKDERVGVESFYTGVDFYYQFLRQLTSRH
jgi:acetylornithine deacetylase/succinyl-diaminopimelate desuccinylase-like protein